MEEACPDLTPRDPIDAVDAALTELVLPSVGCMRAFVGGGIFGGSAWDWDRVDKHLALIWPVHIGCMWFQLQVLLALRWALPRFAGCTAHYLGQNLICCRAHRRSNGALNNTPPPPRHVGFGRLTGPRLRQEHGAGNASGTTCRKW